MLLVNSFNDYSPWANKTETFSWLDRIGSLSFVILLRIYTEVYENNYLFLSNKSKCFKTKKVISVFIGGR